MLGEGGRAAGKESGGCVQEEIMGCGGKGGLRWRDGEEGLIYLGAEGLLASRERSTFGIVSRHSSNIEILEANRIECDWSQKDSIH